MFISKEMLIETMRDLNINYHEKKRVAENAAESRAIFCNQLLNILKDFINKNENLYDSDFRYLLRKTYRVVNVNKSDSKKAFRLALEFYQGEGDWALQMISIPYLLIENPEEYKVYRTQYREMQEMQRYTQKQARIDKEINKLRQKQTDLLVKHYGKEKID